MNTLVSSRPCYARDGIYLLIGPTYQDVPLTILPNFHHVTLLIIYGIVPCPIDGEAYTRASFNDTVAELLTLFANTSREDKCINFPAKLEPVRADQVKDSVFENIVGEPRTLVSVLLPNDLAKVRSASQSLPARFLVENILGFGDPDRRDEALIVRYLGGVVGVMEDEGWIDGPGTRRTRETGNRRKAHGSVKRLAVTDRTDRRAGAEV